MEIVKNIAEFKQKRFQGNFYSRPGFVVIHGDIHKGVEEVIWKMVKNCDLRIVVLLPNCNETYDNWKKGLGLDEIKKNLKVFNLDFLFVPDFLEKNWYELENFVLELNQPWKNLLEGSFIPEYASKNIALYLNLFGLIQPKHLFIGQKDYYLARLLSDLIYSLLLDIELHVIESVRNNNGILFTGRMKFIDDSLKVEIEAVNRTLEFINRMINNNKKDIEELEILANEFVSSFKNFRLKKIYFLDAVTLNPVVSLHKNSPILLVIMGTLDNQILIDNIII